MVKVVSSHEFKKYFMTGVWTPRDPLPFDDALELMIRRAREDLKDKIDIHVDIETWDDGVTKTVRLTTLLCEERDV